MAVTGWSGGIGRWKFRGVIQLLVVDNFLGSVETKTALSATIGTDGKEKQDPIFQNPAALGAMHVHASTAGTRLFRMVGEQPQDTLHWNSIIPRSVPGGNPRKIVTHLVNAPGNQSAARTCSA